MKRIPVKPRENWREKVKEAGLLYHHTDEGIWWDESAYYEFSAVEVDALDDAANELHGLCLSAVQHVIDGDRFEELAIPAAAVPLIRNSWQRREPTLYGRFDFAYDGATPPKLLEYNADTPTSLLEASVVQWFWLEELFPDADQFNSIHERLEEGWQRFSLLKRGRGKLFFGCVSGHLEDLTTITYLQDTANGQGFATERIFVEDVGWNSDTRQFVDLDNLPIQSIFKLYPWEWLIADKFGPFVLDACERMTWIEPIWKMILSNKGILPILWELHPGHPNLLEAYFDNPRGMDNYVRKPKLSREGANITIYRDGREITGTAGNYGQEGFICQAIADIPDFEGNYPVLGCWIINGNSAGMGIRETRDLITFKGDRFVPHLFV